MKEQFKGKHFKQGSYSGVLIIIVVAIVIVINLAVGQMPTTYSMIDVTENKIYTIGDETKELLDGLEDDIEIYYICQDGEEDDYVSKMLDLYDDASSKVTVTQVDPVVNPTFATQYTDEDVYNNSVVVTCGDAYKYVSYEDMYIIEIDYDTYSYSTTGFDGEGCVTSAIDYVTSENLPTMYILQGHDETEISSTLEERIERENITIEYLSLVTLEAVPDDCDLLLINAPETDLSEDEAQYIIDYLDQGGKVFMTSNYSETELPNFESILEHYGLSITEGIVVEGSSGNYYPSYPSYLLPTIESHTITSTLSDDSKYVLLPSAQGIEISDDVRDTVTISTLLSTSDSAYSKVNVTTATTTEKEDGDIDGPFALAVAVTETIESTDDEEDTDSTEDEEDSETQEDETEESTDETEDETEESTDETSDDEDEEEEEDAEAQLVYVSTAYLLDDSINSVVSDGNYDFFMNAVSWMSKDSTTVSIAEKSLSYDYLTVSAGTANMWGLLLIFIVPAAVLIVGVVVWARRRKK